VTPLLIPTKGPSCWKQFLAKEKHWKAGYSAMALAHCWEEATIVSAAFALPEHCPIQK